MKNSISTTRNLLFLFSILLTLNANAFCGFYVAKADAKLFNKSSQVIISRNGEDQTITMSNDFSGEVKDFAMVVPVPSILKKEDIKVVEQSIFDKLDAYSGPRLVEYNDYNPCQPQYELMMDRRPMMSKSVGMANEGLEPIKKIDYKVKIEATYTIGEYDILILSAEESGGLKSWLLDNGYKIPEKAEEVLDPYIKSNMKFFVVKVNLGEQKKMGMNKLRPIQIHFQSPKFMLPIRLGMANANGSQDLIIYCFSQKGRIETTNYKTLKIPTDKNIPENLKPKFGEFYKDLFAQTFSKDQQATYLEYSWNLNSNNYTHCDPCSGTPPKYQEFVEAGVSWVTPYTNQQDYSRISDYDGNVFFTRLHVRYDRQHFPQDLIFQETPNQENFQGRYIMQHAVKEKLNCNEAAQYYAQVFNRRKKEIEELKTLTGWDVSNFNSYLQEYGNYSNGNSTQKISPNKKTNNKQKSKKQKSDWNQNAIVILLGIFALSQIFFRIKNSNKI